MPSLATLLWRTHPSLGRAAAAHPTVFRRTTPILAGADAEERERLLLPADEEGCAENFRTLCGGGCVAVDSIDDAAEYDVSCDALDGLFESLPKPKTGGAPGGARSASSSSAASSTAAWAAEGTAAVWTTVAAVLHLGNVAFQAGPATEDVHGVLRQSHVGTASMTRPHGSPMSLRTGSDGVAVQPPPPRSKVPPLFLFDQSRGRRAAKRWPSWRRRRRGRSMPQRSSGRSTPLSSSLRCFAARSPPAHNYASSKSMRHRPHPTHCKPTHPIHRRQRSALIRPTHVCLLRCAHTPIGVHPSTACACTSLSRVRRQERG